MSERMREWWLSWYHLPSYSEFEMHTPWWISGMRLNDDAATIVAMVRAPSEQEAWRVVQAAYDIAPKPGVEQRFCDEIPPGVPLPWDHEDPRFAWAEWMVW